MSARKTAAAVALVVCALPLVCAQAGAQSARVRFETALGAFEVARAPMTTANFLRYVVAGTDVVRAIHRARADGETLTPPIVIARAARVLQ